MHHLAYWILGHVYTQIVRKYKLNKYNLFRIIL